MELYLLPGHKGREREKGGRDRSEESAERRCLNGVTQRRRSRYAEGVREDSCRRE